VKQAFKEVNFRQASLALIGNCESIITNYQRQGLRLTLRQLYYQLVTRNLVKNEEKSYKNLSKIVSDGRLAGMLDWDAIEDRGRRPRNPPEFGSLKDLVEAAIASYRLPRWEGQQYYCELWVEKDALAGVLEPLARRFHVTLMVNKGYSSQSAMYEAANRFIENSLDGVRNCKLFYLGDHDPSGEDMVRDIRDRLNMFNADVQVEKIGLTMAQIQQYNPPPNPAKITDPRAEAYIARHGNQSWEVDALDPATLARLVTESFEEVIDQDMMDEVVVRENKDKEKLRKATV
jgi:hypothetical protein